MLKSLTKKLTRLLKRLKGKEKGITSLEFEHGFRTDVPIPTQKFFICFSGAGDFWIAHFLKPGFTHVSIMEKIPLGYIVHDPHRCALDTYILPDAPEKEFVEILIGRREDYTVVEVVKEVGRKDFNQIKFGLQSCVSIVSYIMGIQLPFHCVTPFRFYKRLLKGGPGFIKVRRV